MYPSRFHYEAPSSIDEALQLLSVYQGEAKVLSGGMSLIPLMKLRFASPSAIIDVNNLPGLDGLHEEGGQLRIGALVRNRDMIRSEVVRSRYPLLASVAPQIADPLVRGRSTLVLEKNRQGTLTSRERARLLFSSRCILRHDHAD